MIYFFDCIEASVFCISANGEVNNFKNNFGIPFLGTLPVSRETDLCLVLMINLNSKFVYRFQALKLNPAEYLRFTNCYRKANIETYALLQ